MVLLIGHSILSIWQRKHSFGSSSVLSKYDYIVDMHTCTENMCTGSERIYIIKILN
jgi:hypothetical protein